MPDTKLSALSLGAAIADTDLFYSAQGPSSVKQPATALGAYAQSKITTLPPSQGGTGTSTAFTQGSVIFAGAFGIYSQDNAKFFWDDTGFSLGLKAGSTLALGGASSGTVSVKAQPSAGTWTLQLPTTAGTNLYVLQTDGTGITSWVPQSGGGGGMAIGGAVTSGTPGSVLFVDGSGDLAQDASHFTFDPTLNILNVGFAGAPGKYTLNSIPAIYRAPNVSGDNWFEGNSGNTTLTGYQNFGTGDFALLSLTTGFQNTCVGANAALHLTSGYSNFVFGSGALQSSQSDAYNTAVGVNCLNTLGNGGAGGGGNTGNFAAGFAALNNALQGFNNVAIGYTALSNVTATANQNVVIGGGAGSLLGFGGGNVSTNTLIGCNAGTNLTGASEANTWIGGFTGPSAVVSGTIAIGTGYIARELLDLSLTTNHVWSFSAVQAGQTPTGLHVYNVQDTNLIGQPPTNYERAVLDWNVTSNTLTIGTQAGGTGVIRPIKWAGLSNKATPVSGDHVLLLDSITSDTMKTATVSSIAGTASISIGSAVGSGTSGSVLFVDSSSQLAQDNTNFFWDDTNKYFKVGSVGTFGAYFLDGQRAIYTVPNVGGDNWFEGAAGNTTLSGTSNFGTGTFALQSLTTGSFNVSIGFNCLATCNTGQDNMAVGYSALASLNSGSRNVAIGSNTLINCLNGSANVGLGFAALQALTSGINNVGIGNGAVGSIVTGSNNVGLGNFALGNCTTDSNIGIGFQVFRNNSTGQFNCGIGFGAGGATTAGQFNTMIGSSSGFSITSGDYNTLIGGWSGVSAAISNVIALTDGTSSIFINNYISGVDFNYTLPNVWSFQKSTTPNGLHVYNTTDTGAPPTNYERAVLDWNVTSNVLTIGTQAGGTGSTRNIEFIVGGTNKLDYGVTNAGLWTFAQATMFATSTTLTNGAAASLGTLTNAPAAGNPTKWIPINDNGTTRYIPAW